LVVGCLLESRVDFFKAVELVADRAFLADWPIAGHDWEIHMVTLTGLGRQQIT
jgi:hypothetical protein